MAGNNPYSGQMQLKTLYIIIITSVLTVTITFLGMSATKVNNGLAILSHPDPVNLADLNRCKCDSNMEDQAYTLYDKYIDGSDVESGANGNFREIVTHSPSDQCVKRLPQAIIAGIQKCGTTALLKFLSAHPQIKACTTPAETMYFSMYYNKPLSWYRDLMPCSYSNEITMEKSPPYFYRGFCAERIRKMDPKTKILLVVKDPIIRTESMYAMIKEDLHGQTFERAITKKNNKNETVLNTNTRLIQFSNYPKYIGAWLKNFNRQQLLVVDGHNFEANPAQELNIIENFLQIGTYFTTDRFIFNQTKGKQCLISDEKGVQCLAAKKGRKHPEYGTKIRDLMVDYFKPLNEVFFKMINRRFEWGY